MALISHSGLPAFARMKTEGLDVRSPDEVLGSKLPVLRVGLLNLMPDAALSATERQFIRLTASISSEADVWVIPFTAAAEIRGPAARRHIADHYTDREALMEEGVDALIITGANPVHPDLSEEAFWGELVEVLDWAGDNVPSVMCSCLATHAVLEHQWSVVRQRLPQKRWGVFEHRVVSQHALLDGVSGPVVAPHSHWYEVTAEQVESTGGRVLLLSDEAGLHLATSGDGRFVYFQGHPEYDSVSLLKEYQREVDRYRTGEREEYPPFPEHYFDAGEQARLEGHRAHSEEAARSGAAGPTFPRLTGHGGEPEWSQPGRVIYRNWLSGILLSSQGLTRSSGGSAPPS